MNETTIMVSGPAGTAAFTFRYRSTLFYGETSATGDREIVSNFNRQMKLHQAILSPFYTGYPQSKGYYQFYAAARNTANELGLSFEVDSPPVCYTPPVIRDIEKAMAKTVDELESVSLDDLYRLEYKRVYRSR